MSPDPDQPRSEEGTGGAEQGDEAAEEQLNLPLDALLDWGSDPTELDKELEAALGEQSAEAIALAERDEYLDALRRLQADFDNFRKRSLRQQTELLEHATEALCVRLLPVLDALDLATEHLASQGEQNDATKAMEQIDSLLRDVLAREGIERIDAVDVAFDPTIHDAVGHVPTEPPSPEPEADDAPVTNLESPVKAPRAMPKHGPKPAKSAKAPAAPAGPVVAKLMRAGYKMKSKVLRPAMVLVKD